MVKPKAWFSRIRLSDDHSAIDIRKELTALRSQVYQPLSPQSLIKRRALQGLAAPLAPHQNIITQRGLHLPVDFNEGQAGVPIAKETPPPSEKPVQTVGELGQGQFDPDLGHLAQFLPCPILAFLKLFWGTTIGAKLCLAGSALRTAGGSGSISSLPRIHPFSCFVVSPRCERKNHRGSYPEI